MPLKGRVGNERERHGSPWQVMASHTTIGWARNLPNELQEFGGDGRWFIG